MHGMDLCPTKRRLRGAGAVDAQIRHAQSEGSLQLEPPLGTLVTFCDIPGGEAYTAGHLFVTTNRRSPVTYFRSAGPEGLRGHIYILRGLFFDSLAHTTGLAALCLLTHAARGSRACVHILKWACAGSLVGNGPESSRKGAHFNVSAARGKPVPVGSDGTLPAVPPGCIRVLWNACKTAFRIVRPCHAQELAYDKRQFMLVDREGKPVFFAGPQKLHMRHRYKYLCDVAQRRVLGPALPHRQDVVVA